MAMGLDRLMPTMVSLMGVQKKCLTRRALGAVVVATAAEASWEDLLEDFEQNLPEERAGIEASAAVRAASSAYPSAAYPLCPLFLPSLPLVRRFLNTPSVQMPF